MQQLIRNAHARRVVSPFPLLCVADMGLGRRRRDYLRYNVVETRSEMLSFALSRAGTD